MGFLDALLGRTKPAQANLDRLFGLPGAQITLEAAEGLQPTGQAGVCFKPAEGQAFTATETEFTALLNLGDDAGAHVSENSDQYGYRWVALGADDFQTLVTRVHMTNSTLQENGFGRSSSARSSASPRRPRRVPPGRRRPSTSSTCTSVGPSTPSSRRAASAGTTKPSSG